MKRRWWILGGIAIAAMMILTWVAAPSQPARHGSTYARDPFGYGAWYASMTQTCEVDIRRWQRSLDQLPGFSIPADPWNDPLGFPEESGAAAEFSNMIQPVVLLRMYGDFSSRVDRSWLEDWVARGNVLINVGVSAPATQGQFRQSISTDAGVITVETTRRAANRVLTSGAEEAKVLLQDEQGILVWQETWERGRIINIVPPFLAANAYQSNPKNFAYFTQLVTEPALPILVDEYIHGYETSSGAEERCAPPPLQGFSDEELPPLPDPPGLWAYLAQTPIALVALQAIALVILVLWGQNQRFGPPLPLVDAKVDNSQAYIQALAAVLYKAAAHPFVVDLLVKAEQRYLQRALGLGTIPVEPEAIASAWAQQTQRSPEDVLTLFSLAQKPRISQEDLLLWLRTMQTVRSHLP